VFIWSCQIAHGGTPIADPKSTRRSLVTHYWRADDMPPPNRALEWWLLFCAQPAADPLRSAVAAVGGARRPRTAVGAAAA